jgi:Rrf2 family nitric oxide-sensitive transcriptional repressor
LLKDAEKMRLTDHTDYSLRVLMYLNQQRRLVTLNELSEKLGVSKNNLIKVSNQLAKLNFIDTERGRSGGLLIKEETGSKSLKDIISRTEETFFMAECFSGQRCGCSFLPGCSLKRSLSEALQAFLNSLAKKTLDDVTPPRKITF